jgi:uncharacterized repeat protein (TIGR01451 family)
MFFVRLLFSYLFYVTLGTLNGLDMKKSYLLILLISFFAKAQIVAIPDPNFKNALVNTNCVGDSSNQYLTDVDTNDDGEVQMEEALAVTKLRVTNQTITDLTGIAYFSNLSILDCSSNQLTSLTINNMAALGALVINYNSISNLSITNCFNLRTFMCDGNAMTTIDLSTTAVGYYRIVNNPNLTYLNLKNGFNVGGAISSKAIPPPLPPELHGNPNLQYICCDASEVTEVSNNGELGVPIDNSITVNSYCTSAIGGSYNTINVTSTLNCGTSAVALANQKFKLNYGTSLNNYTYSNLQGNATFYSGQNTITVTPVLENPDYYTVTPESYSYTFTGTSETITPSFCYTPLGTHPDLEVNLIPQQRARPGFTCIYQLVYKNKGNQLQSGALTLAFNGTILSPVSATPATNTSTASSMTWNFQDLAPMETRYVLVYLNLNSPQATPAVNIGDVLQYQLSIASSGGDETPADNVLVYNQTVVGSFDPNDKEVLEGESISIDRLGDYLHYVIRFQNTGTDYAENVVLKDLLVFNLDWITAEVIGSSHPYRCTLTSGYQLEVFYDGINLPASAIDEAGSHGYFAFKIKPKSTLQVNSAIPNNANIYFDYNYPITTNTVTTTFTTLGIPKPEAVAAIRLYPNPTQNQLSIAVANDGIITDVTIANTLGQVILTTKQTTAVDLSSLAAGTYFVTVTTDKGRSTEKLIKL